MPSMQEIEAKWQKAWEIEKVFETKDDPGKKKFYCLEMFPYPSGSGLHMGHAFNYIIGDIYSRFKRMQGHSVLYPMGYDSAGLPAENAAIKEGVHPKPYTEKSIANFIRQQKELGLSYDWSKMVTTHTPDYYKWNQYFFLKFYEKGLVYRKKAPVNYCPVCKTVLANEQVHNGKCWRHKETDVEIRQLEQWFFKITNYADELLDKVDSLQWPERIKAMQKNWIGKSFGVEINFKINGKDWPIFTTRPDTLYGVTFMVVSAQHSKLMELVTPEQKPKIEQFLKKVKSTSEKDMQELEKEGEFTGSYAINPVTGDKVPVYTGNFVVAEYGSGMVMAVPSHDQRDFEFAKKYGLEIKVVINPKGKELDAKTMKEAYVDEGILVNSQQFSGIENKKAIEEIAKYLESKGLGKKTTLYKLRDWLISRQRYWGTPIPVVYCDKCGIVPVPESQLPVELPFDVKFGEGNPLATNAGFVNATCPKCREKARRETDTMDTFVDSSWYFLRYADNKNSKEPFDKKKAEYWMPVDQYIGGAEHACMHLIYARFFTKALRDLGFVKVDEPFTKLFNQGMLHGEDGFVMSKSRGNVILPEEISKKYGIDTARFFLMSIASPDKDLAWNSDGIEGSYKFINKILSYFETVKIGKSNKRIESKINKAIKELTDDIDNFRYNFAIIKLRQLFEALGQEESKETLEAALKLLHPFCPHITEEIWHTKFGQKTFLTISKWPIADERKIDASLEENEKNAEKLASDINSVINVMKAHDKVFSKVFVYALPKEVEGYKENIESIKTSIGMDVTIYAVNDKEKYDPQGKAAKAKPGKPAIYLE